MLDNMIFDLYLIRHGESEANACPDKMGQKADVKLTATGKHQAELLRQHFLARNYTFDYIYSSPYDRTVATARIIFEDSPIIYAPELVEYDAGDWTDHSRSATINDDIRLKMGYQNMGFRPPNGESMNMVERRVSKWLDEEILYNKDKLEYLYGLDKPLEIAAVSHGMTIKSVLHYVMGFDKSFLWKVDIGNTSVTKISYGNNGWRLRFINNTSHLE